MSTNYRKLPNFRLDSKDRETIVAMLRSGESVSVIAQRFGVTPKTIRCIRRENKIQKPLLLEPPEKVYWTDHNRLDRARRQAELELLGWRTFTARTAKFLCLVNQAHGVRPIQRIYRKSVLLSCGCSRAVPFEIYRYGKQKGHKGENLK